MLMMRVASTPMGGVQKVAQARRRREDMGLQLDVCSWEKR